MHGVSLPHQSRRQHQGGEQAGVAAPVTWQRNAVAAEKIILFRLCYSTFYANAVSVYEFLFNRSVVGGVDVPVFVHARTFINGGCVRSEIEKGI